MKVSVITVVYNSFDSIEKTIKSVLRQKYSDLEFILIDGGSTDGTIEIINKYLNCIDFFESTPDLGIYDAMNKGVSRATGDYLVFMNSGDSFFDTNIVKMAMSDSNGEHLVVGGCLVAGDVEQERKLDVRSFSSGRFLKMPVCHQSIFSLRSLHLKFAFNLEYSIAADFDFFLKSIVSGADIYVSSDIYSVISRGGVSDVQRIRCWNEYERIAKSNYKLTIIDSMYYIYVRLKERCKGLIKRCWRAVL